MTVPPIGIDRLPSGLLEWPAATPRSEQLQLRATWEHVTTKLRDRVKLASSVWAAVMSIEGVADEVLTDIILRHFERCASSTGEDLRPTELAHLLSVLIGVDHAIELVRSCLAILEEGRQESWYEAKLRKKYGG